MTIQELQQVLEETQRMIDDAGVILSADDRERLLQQECDRLTENIQPKDMN